MEKNNLDSWEGFTGSNFLRSEMVKDEDHTFTVVGAEQHERDGDVSLWLHLESIPLKVTFDVNKTNAKKLQELGAANPKDLIGKKIYFKKVLVRNPKTNQEVESLRVYKLE